MKLRIDMKRFNGEKGYVHYSTFVVGSKSDKYKLKIGGFKGSIGMSKYLQFCIQLKYISMREFARFWFPETKSISRGEAES
jgi:hypothetical protein